MKAQRLRFRYRLGADACGLSQRDLVTTWEQSCKAAGLPLAYSTGRRSSPFISIAAPLPQGVTSDCEILDLVLASRVSPADARARVSTALPSGICVFSVEEVGVNAPSLQSQVRWAQYQVTVKGLDQERVDKAIRRILEAKSLPTEYRRENKVRAYDLRPLIFSLEVASAEADAIRIEMRLRAEPDRTARADQVAAELGLPEDRRIHRTHLVLEEVPAVLLAHRRESNVDEE